MIVGDEPIESRPDAVLAFCTVIDLDGIRIERGLSKFYGSAACQHLHVKYSTSERRVWCDDCASTIEGFDAFKMIAEHWHKLERGLQIKRQEVEEALAHSLISRAAKIVDRYWRKHKSAPMCPHCRAGLLPEDFISGNVGSVSIEYEMARRNKKSALDAERNAP